MLHHCPDPGIDAPAWHSRHWWRALALPELRVILSADTVEIFISAARGGKHNALLQHSVHVVPVIAHAMHPHAAVWQTLAQALSTLNIGPVHAVLVLSNQFVRYLVVPWHAAVTSPSERASYHAHCLQHHFGEQAAQWHAMAAPTSYGESSLLCAVQPALLTQANTVFSEAGLHLSAVYPAWMLTVNQTLYHMRKQRQPSSGWVLCRESGNLTLGSLHQGQWLTVESQPLTANHPAWTDTLWQMLQRSQGSQSTDHCLWAHALALPPTAQAQFSGLTIHSLEGRYWPGDRLHSELQRRAV